MDKQTTGKLIVSGFGLALADFLVCRLLGFHLAGTSLLPVLGGWITTLLFVAVFFWLYRRFEGKGSKPKESGSLIDLEGLERSARAVKKANPKVFKKQMRDLDSQMLRVSKKAEQLDQSLKDYFGGSKISYAKFAGTINGALTVFEDNVSRILSRIAIFDEDGYEALFKKHLEYTDAILPYQKSFEEIDEDLKVNESILQRLDRLLQEVNHLNTPGENLDALPAMQELGELIDQTKLYRQNG